MEQILFKSEGHSLPCAIFNEMKRKNLLPQYWSYEKLIHKAIFDIAHNEIYKFLITESKETDSKNLKQYEGNKV